MCNCEFTLVNLIFDLINFVIARSVATTKQSFGMNVKLLNLVFCNNYKRVIFKRDCHGDKPPRNDSEI